MRRFGFFQARPMLMIQRGSNRSAAARGQTPLKRDARGHGEFGRAAQRDLIAGIEREQVRDVAMPRLGFVIVLGPFLQLAVLADFQLR